MDPNESRPGCRALALWRGRQSVTLQDIADRLIDTPSQSVRSSIQRAEPEPVRVSVPSLRNMSGERKIPCKYLQCCKENP